MLSYTFMDILLTSTIFVVFTLLWWIYYLFTNVITTPKLSNTDAMIKVNPSTTSNIHCVIPGLSLLLIFFANYLLISHFNTTSLFWDSLYLSNNTMTFFFLSIIVMLAVTTAIIALRSQNISFNLEYIIFIYLIIITGYFLISSTNLFISIFFLEFVALLIFGKFTVSKVVFKHNQSTTINSGYINQYSYGLFNALFFQFWANFVSSIFLFFSLINIHYMCGTSNFFMMNFIFNVVNLNWVYSEYFMIINLSVLITGLFIKLGLSPYQFFKIETYKGIPLFMVILYTTVYLLIYIYFFIYLIIYQFTIIKVIIANYLVMFAVLSLLYLISLLFDTKNFKAFLSYSTLITITNIFIIILTI